MTFGRVPGAWSVLHLVGLAVAVVVFASGCGTGGDAPQPATSAGSVVSESTSTDTVANGLGSVSGDARSLVESWRRAVSASAGIWPGYELAAVPTVLVSVDPEGNVEAVVAFNHPDPQALGSPVRGFDMDGHRVVVVEEVANPDELASMAPFDFFADVGGTETFVLVGRSGEPGMEPGTPEFVALLAHEAFHRYQFDHWVPGTAFQDVEGYDFGAENLELALLENRILIAAYEAVNAAETERLARQFAGVRAFRHQRDPRIALDEQQERIEGSARWIEHGMGDAIGSVYTSANHTSEIGHLDDGLDDPGAVIGSVKSFLGFGRFYSSGATLLALLDRLRVASQDVAERLRAGDTPAQLLEQRIAPLGDRADVVGAARAEHDPHSRLGAAAVVLAELAAGEGETDFGTTDVLPETSTGSFEPSADQIACLEDHGLDLSADALTIPDEVAGACFDEPEP